jgi:hypothetical protein
MTISVADPVAVAVRCDDENLWVTLADGRQLGVPLAYFPRLLHATSAQRAAFELSGSGRGIHWDELDEDISVSGLLAGRGDQSRAGQTERGSSAGAATADAHRDVSAVGPTLEQDESASPSLAPEVDTV